MRIRIQGFDEQKLKNFYSLLIPRPPQRTAKLQEKPTALKREHPALQNMKFLYFFLFLWVIFALLDPDPAIPINADPEPKPWYSACAVMIFTDFQLQSNLYTFFDENYLLILQKEHENNVR
jgi:hypothetical protein